jgi:hypothetical protein
MAIENVAQGGDNIPAIRQALLIGLESFGEVERLTDRHQTLSQFGKAKPDDGLMPIHPTGAADTIGVFATALRLLDDIEAPPEKASKPAYLQFVPDAQRVSLALEAASQIDTLVKLLMNERESDNLLNALPILGPKIGSLVGAQFAALSDELETIANIKESLGIDKGVNNA